MFYKGKKEQRVNSQGRGGKLAVNPRLEEIKIVVIGKIFFILFHNAAVLGKNVSEWKSLLTIDR